MTLMGKATEKGLEDVARRLLPSTFHKAGDVAKKVSSDPFAFPDRDTRQV